MDNKLPDRKRALGRGLEQLFNTENLDMNTIEKQIYDTVTNEEIVNLRLEDLRVNPYQPRKNFDQEALNDLANSIKEHGVFQPIIVKKSIKGYEIIAGERRCRASKIAGLNTIPAIIRNFTNEQMMEIALLENLQRENLSVIEEAIAYKNLIEKLNLTQAELSDKVGKSRSHVTNILGLLRLPQEIQNMVTKGNISMGHARAISKLESSSDMMELANKIIKDNIPVRELEKITNENEMNKKVVQVRKVQPSSKFKFVEDLLRDKLDTKIKIKDKKIEISFSNVNDLNRILEILDVKEF